MYKYIFFSKYRRLNWRKIKGQNIENELILIHYFLKKDSVFFDIGANLGQYIYASSKTLKSENIYAFEPNPKLNQRLKQIFRSIHVTPLALSNFTGHAAFKIPIINSREIDTRGTLKLEHLEIDESNFNLLHVNIDTMDNYMEKQGISKVDLIKIDVEGAEFDVLDGASLTIQNKRPVLLVEIEQRHHKDLILDRLKTFEARYKYKTYYFDPNEQQIMNDIYNKDIHLIQALNNHGKNRNYINNFLCIPKEKTENGEIEFINTQIKKTW